jgi:hypothetical protein
MGVTKMMYVYDTYDSIIESIESISGHHLEQNKQLILQKIRDFRDELPSTKDVCNEFADNYDTEEGIDEFRNFIKTHKEIDDGDEE